MEGKLHAYRKEETSGKSHVELVIQVYDGAIAAMQKAAECYRGEDNARGREQLERARRFVTHLYTTLNHDKGGDISQQLGKLYAFVINQINVAEATKDLALIDDNITVLNNLRSAWCGLRDMQKQSGPPPTVEQTPADGTFNHSA